MEKDSLIEKSLKLVNIQKFDDALKILEQIKIDDYKTYFLKGTIYLAQNKHDLAEKNLTLASKQNNKNYLINRGWISFDQKNQSEINFLNEDKIIGTLKLQTKASIFKPENDIENNYWFTLNREDVFKYTGKNFSNFIIYLNGDYKTPEPKVITANISNNHKKYAITWFSMAISILLIYLYFRRKNY